MSLKDLDARKQAGDAAHEAVDQLLAGLGKEDREALLRALTDKKGRLHRWPAPELAKRLRNDGHAISRYAIEAWRRRAAQ